MPLISNQPSPESQFTKYRQLAQTISDEVAISIENARLYESMEREHRELQKALDGIIHAMSLVMETRDPYTAHHQRRVAGLACAIVREMHLSQWQLKGVRIAALLHDIGKMVVPAEIIGKPGPLDRYEFEIIKTHPRSGYEILKMIEFPWPVTRAILQHHERLDGSGYPDGLSGEDIILEARILGVADVIEAMSSQRAYRPAHSIDDCLEEIWQKRNISYDQDAADVCMDLFTKKDFSFTTSENEVKSSILFCFEYTPKAF